jgi:multidrug efflux pump subunit AcrA (membrane-fusion protein)
MKIKTITILHVTVLICLTCGNQPVNFNNEPRRVRGAIAAVRELPDTTSGFGSLSFVSKVDVTSAQEAVIKKINFREGDLVRQGDVLFLLENPQINLAVERAQNNYSQALAARNLANSRLLEGMFQAEAQLMSLEKSTIELSLAKRKWEEDNRKHQNQETLFRAGGIHTEAILVSRFNIETAWEQILLMEKELEIRFIGRRDQDLVMAGISVPLDEIQRKEALVFLITSSLRAELYAANARLDAADKELTSVSIALSELTVQSPTSGVVGARYFEERERVRPLDKIISIIDTTSLYAIFPLRERDALRIEKGMKASVLIDGTGETREGIVDLIYPQADSQSLSFLVRVLMSNDGVFNANRLKPGMFARITVNLGQPKASIFIPESAIFNQRNNEGSVFVINGTTLVERKISFGSSYGEEREVTAGLNAGEFVVLRPDSDLREGSNVTVIE